MATEQTKLWNRGERKIHYGAGENDVLKPGAGKIFPTETAKNLLRLFKGELIDPDTAVEGFAEITEESVEPEKLVLPTEDEISQMTVAELKEVLAEMNFEAPKNEDGKALDKSGLIAVVKKAAADAA